MQTIQLVSTEGNAKDIQLRAVRDLEASLSGDVYLRGVDGYSESRAVWNGMIDAEPSVVALPETTDDAVRVVAFARDNELVLGIRGGGHNVAGTPLIQDGLMLNLSRMRRVTVDPKSKTAFVEGGATLSDVDKATQEHGVAVPSGFVSETGIAGLCLRGGLGHLMRRFGLTCDSLRAAELVTANGEVLRVSETEKPGLLWALRGGGVNLGVVTRFEFDVHDLGPEVNLVMPVFAADAGKDAIAAMNSYIDDAPDELGVIGFYGYLPDDEEFPEEVRGREVFVFYGCYSGPPEQAQGVTAPLVEFAEPLADLSNRLPYTELQKFLDEDYPDGGRYYWRSLFLDHIDDRIVEVIHRYGTDRPSRLSTLDLWAMGGAVSRVEPDDTAFRRRNARYMLAVEANWESPENDDANITWARSVTEEIGKFSSQGAYLNFAGSREEGKRALSQAYGPNMGTLKSLKQQYDPRNIFG